MSSNSLVEKAGLPSIDIRLSGRAPINADEKSLSNADLIQRGRDVAIYGEWAFASHPRGEMRGRIKAQYIPKGKPQSRSAVSLVEALFKAGLIDVSGHRRVEKYYQFRDRLFADNTHFSKDEKRRIMHAVKKAESLNSAGYVDVYQSHNAQWVWRSRISAPDRVSNRRLELPSLSTIEMCISAMIKTACTSTRWKVASGSIY